MNLPKSVLKYNINILSVLILDVIKAPLTTYFRVESHSLLKTAVDFNMNFVLFTPYILLYSKQQPNNAINIQ
jgi:hypothetical protein